MKETTGKINTKKHAARKILAGLFAMSLLLFYVPAADMVAPDTVSAAVDETIRNAYPNAVFLQFADSGITTEGTTGYTVTGTDVEITADGTYVLSGSCTNGSITVKKGLTVTLVLNGLTLTEPDEGSCPIWSKSDSVLNIVVAEGTVNTLSDASHDGNKPKACINAGGDINISGSGSLTVNGNNKNGIKADNNLVSESATLIINSVGNGLAADNKLTINSGSYKINDGNDAIKAAPETTDNDEDGNIEINGGTFEIVSAEDGIQAEANLTIKNGTFNIKTGGGHTTSITSSDETSYKALKADKYLTIYDGDYTIDSADDAIHAGEYAYLIGGTFNISTGDDGAHADTSLIIGEENGDDSKLTVNINDSYEGLEAGTVYIYSGYVNIISSDDGINAAGGSDGNNQEPGGQGGFNPGGGGGFNPGGGGGMGPGGGGPGMPGGGTNPESSDTDYSINISGGIIYANVEGDGFDSNGTINITGGTSIIWGAASNGRTSDNSTLDWGERSTCTISGGTVFAAGSRQMAETPSTSGSQKCITISGTTRNSGEAINIVDSSGNAVFSTYSKKTINHVIYSSPSLTSVNGSLSDVTDSLLLEDGAQVGNGGNSDSGNGGNSGTGGNGNSGSSAGDNSGTEGSGGSGKSAGNNNGTGSNGNAGTGNNNSAGSTGSNQVGQAGNTGTVTTGSTGTVSSENGQTNSGAGTATTTDTTDSTDTDTSDTSTGTISKTVKGITYVLNGKSVTVKSVSKNIKKAVIPNKITINGKKYSVTAIGSKAFAGCKKLTSVTIGANVVKIGKKAFYNCTSLKNITFKGSNAPKIGKNAFKNINKNAVFHVTKTAQSGYKAVLFKNCAGYTKSWKIK